MVSLKKIQDTLVKNLNSEGSSFLDVPRKLTFSNEYENGDKGFFIINNTQVSVELDYNVILFDIKDVMIDDIIFDTSQELINYIYNL